MTNKIASEVLKASSIQQMAFCKVIVDGKPYSVKEALDTAVKALEQDTCDELMRTVDNGIILPEGHGKIVDLGNIDRDKIDKDNSIITININDTEMEVVPLDYFDNLPDLTKKEEEK